MDLDRAERFYTGVLGLRVCGREPGVVYLASDDSGHEIALHAHGAHGPAPPISLGCRFVGFEVPSPRALVRICDRLRGSQFMVVEARDSLSVHTTDADGHGIEIYCRAPRDGAAAMAARTLTLADLRAAARREEVTAAAT
jgi:catechol-2,3-dioxygenase